MKTTYKIYGLLAQFYDNEEAEAMKFINKLKDLGITCHFDIIEDEV